MRKPCIFILLILITRLLTAQTDLDSLLNANLEKPDIYAYATFKATRIISGHSIERMQKHDLDFRISHRFGNINGGAYELFGLDYSSSNFSLEYGINNWLMLGVGRATYEKTFSGFTKISLLRQRDGSQSFPISISYVGGIFCNSMKWDDTTRTNYFSSRLSYLHQALIARKLNGRISVQLSPMMIHRNLVEREDDNNDIFAAGFGGRIKLTTRTSLNVEYFYILDRKNVSSAENTNPLSIGFDIETGSHVFQIHVSNAPLITENAFIGNTTGKWGNGDLHIGFNITRVFTLSGNKNEEDVPL